MKFILKNKKTPEKGEKRQRTFFAIMPVKIKNEIRWLEKVTIEETFQMSGPSCDGGDLCWRHPRFL